MTPTVTLLLYCVVIIGASLVGGWLPMLVRLTHRRMELALSFISGVMLGVALLLLLPHAVSARIEAHPIAASEDAHAIAHAVLGPLMLCLLAGFLTMFFIERFFCYHHHDAPDDAAAHSCHDHEHAPHAHVQHRLTWSGAAIGLTLHGLLDGVAIAASVAAAHHHGSWMLAGMGTFIVVLLHKPFDALTLGTLMAAGSQSRGRHHVINILFALVTPLGAVLFTLGISGAGESQGLILSAALAFAAGTFLCIALSDVLPELQFHQHDRVQLSAALVIGLALAWGVAELETRLHVHAHHDQSMPHTHDPHAGHRH